MTMEQHLALLEIRRIIFTAWVNDPCNEEKTRQLDLMDKALGWGTVPQK